MNRQVFIACQIKGRDLQISRNPYNLHSSFGLRPKRLQSLDINILDEQQSIVYLPAVITLTKHLTTANHTYNPKKLISQNLIDLCPQKVIQQVCKVMFTMQNCSHINHPLRLTHLPIYAFQDNSSYYSSISLQVVFVYTLHI